jgi:hypothetical protein
LLTADRALVERALLDCVQDSDREVRNYGRWCFRRYQNLFAVNVVHLLSSVDDATKRRLLAEPEQTKVETVKNSIHKTTKRFGTKRTAQSSKRSARSTHSATAATTATATATRRAPLRAVPLQEQAALVASAAAHHNKALGQQQQQQQQQSGQVSASEASARKQQQRDALKQRQKLVLERKRQQKRRRNQLEQHQLEQKQATLAPISLAQQPKPAVPRLGRRRSTNTRSDTHVTTTQHASSLPCGRERTAEPSANSTWPGSKHRTANSTDIAPDHHQSTVRHQRQRQKQLQQRQKQESSQPRARGEQRQQHTHREHSRQPQQQHTHAGRRQDQEQGPQPVDPPTQVSGQHNPFTRTHHSATLSARARRRSVAMQGLPMIPTERPSRTSTEQRQTFSQPQQQQPHFIQQQARSQPSLFAASTAVVDTSSSLSRSSGSSSSYRERLFGSADTTSGRSNSTSATSTAAAVLGTKHHSPLRGAADDTDATPRKVRSVNWNGSFSSSMSLLRRNRERRATLSQRSFHR